MKRYNSKIDKGFVWFPSLILIAVALLLIVEKAWLGLPIVIAIALYLIDMFRNTHYSIEDRSLTIVAGRFYKVQIPISSIRIKDPPNNHRVHDAPEHLICNSVSCLE